MGRRGPLRQGARRASTARVPLSSETLVAVIALPPRRFRVSAFPQTLHSLEADQDATKFSRAFLGAWDHGLPRAAEVADLRLSLGEQAVLMLDESRLAELVATRAPCDTYLLYARRALASGTYWTVQVGDREHVRSSLGTFSLSL